MTGSTLGWARRSRHSARSSPLNLPDSRSQEGGERSRKLMCLKLTERALKQLVAITRSQAPDLGRDVRVTWNGAAKPGSETHRRVLFTPVQAIHATPRLA